MILLAEKNKLSTMSATGNSTKTIEKIFVPKHQYGNYKKSNNLTLFSNEREFSNRQLGKNKVVQWQKDMAHWATRHQLYATCDFKDFEPRKGFKCIEYYKNR